MGGVHASMVAGMYPGAVALTPLLAPRSAASAYCTGALRHATAWPRLAAEAEGRGPEVREQLARAGRATDALRAARYLLDETDGETARTGVPAGTAPGRAAEARGSEATGTQGTEVPSPPGTADGGVWAGVGGLAERLLKWVAMLERREEHAAAVALLAQVLEAFTDVSRFPRRAGKGGGGRGGDVESGLGIRTHCCRRIVPVRSIRRGERAITPCMHAVPFRLGPPVL